MDSGDDAPKDRRNIAPSPVAGWASLYTDCFKERKAMSARSRADAWSATRSG